MITATASTERAGEQAHSESAVRHCRLLDADGSEIARGEALVALDDGFLVAMV
jgi:hypothetical protein